MNTIIPDDMRNNPAKWPSLSDEQWVALHVPRFTAARPGFEAYEKFLEAVLKEACRKLAPLAIVNARAKSIASFAEKILRKRKLYTDPKDPHPPDPLVRMTDLCGGRVIAQTAEQVEQVCRFIEAAFTIDWDNSEDVSQRLKPTEFGYRSVHYIVIPDAARLKTAGMTTPIPPEIAGLKAEIQIRTLLEHASADIGHDTIYKAGMIVPNQIKRHYAALAAVLEGADREFGRLFQSLHDFKSNYGAWHRPDEVKQEISRLQIVLEFDPANQILAVNIGQLALAIGQHQIALDVLEPFRSQASQGVQRVLGTAITELHWDNPRGPEFRQGRDLLQAACGHSQKDAETLCALAECWANTNDDDEAGKLFRQAVELDATEPLTVCRFLEFEIAHLRNYDMVPLTAPMIRKSMERCHKEIEAKVNLPIAWSCLAVFQLLMREPFESIQSLAQVMTCCGKPGVEEHPSHQPCAAGRILKRTRDTLRRLRCIREKLEGYEWFERVLLLGLAAQAKDADALDQLRKLASWGSGKPHFNAADHMVILSGGCSPKVQPAMDGLRPHLLRATEGLAFTLISGGTPVGISGVAGELAAASGGRIRAFGYLPSLLPLGIQEDHSRYAVLVTSSGKDFTPLDPLQAWTDLFVAGVDLRRVKLLSYAGGQISKVENAVALALGARVAVIDGPAVSKDRQFKDPLWQDHPQLIRLPLDAMTLRAFLLVDAIPAGKEELVRLEKAAQLTHEDYVKSATPKEPSLASWKDLADDLKLSNYHQVIYAENILRTAGLEVRPAINPDAPLLDMAQAIGEGGIRRLAEMEHGRWNVERLLRGWRFADKKDVVNKLSPFLVPWEHLTPEIQKYDTDAIRSLPAKLRGAGLEVFRKT
jgi:ppGpp synthetase/RelA/SpoT-type nucleotidyltranferase